MKGSPVDPNRLYASQSSGWFGQLIQRSDDGGKTWEPVGNKFVYDGTARHAPVVRRHAASLGVQTRLASRTVADRSRHRVCRRRGRRPVPHDRRRPDLARTPRPARPRHRGQMAAGGRRHGPAHDHPRSEQSRSASSSPSRPRAPSAPTTAARPGSRSTAASSPSTCPTRTPRSASAFTASPCTASRPNVLFMQLHWNVMRTDDAGDIWHRSAATCRPTSASRSKFTPTSRTPSMSCRSRAIRSISSTKASCASSAAARGGNEWEPLTKGLPQENCYVNVLRDAMAVDSLDQVRRLFRHHRRPGVRLGRRRR